MHPKLTPEQSATFATLLERWRDGQRLQVSESVTQMQVKDAVAFTAYVYAFEGPQAVLHLAQLVG